MKANYELIPSIFENPNGPKSIPKNADIVLCILYAKIWPDWKDIFENPSPANVWPPGPVLNQFIKVLESSKKYKKFISTLDDSDDGWSLYKLGKKWRISFTAYPKGNHVYYVSIGVLKNGLLDPKDIAADYEDEDE